MSVHNTIKRMTVPQLQAKKGKEPIVSLTAYQAYSARIADPYCDFLLVGDSVGMVVYGMDTTLAVDLDMMLRHGQAVVRASKQAMVVVDMPFGTYECSPEDAFKNASRLLAETGCTAVKLEGGEKMAQTVRFLTERGIPVMGHVGLTPQSVNVMGGFKTQGRKQEDWARIENDAQVLQEAGAFSIVLEGIVEPLAVKITQKLAIPTIGIGASAACDGQILVMEDMLGFYEFVPKFVRRYGQLGDHMEKAISTYARDVIERSFPDEKEVYK